jgi:drug/metabolite transporter (DMT)-like permease
MFLLQGLTGIYINQFLFLLGLKLTSANTAAIFQPLSVIVTVAAAVLFRFERLTWRKACGFLLGIGGAVVMAELWKGGNSKNGIGVALLTFGTVSSSLYYLLQKPTYHRYEPLTMTAYQYLCGCLCMGLSSLYCTSERAAFEQPGYPGYLTWITLEYAILVASTINYFLMTWANKHIEATMVTVYGLVQPFSTAALAYFALRQSMPLRELGGAGLVVCGIALVCWQNVIDTRESSRAPAEPAINGSDEGQRLLAS